MRHNIYTELTKQIIMRHLQTTNTIKYVLLKYYNRFYV